METSPLASMKASAAFSTSGWKEVAPEQEMEPASSAAGLLGALAALGSGLLGATAGSEAGDGGQRHRRCQRTDDA